MGSDEPVVGGGCGRDKKGIEGRREHKEDREKMWFLSTLDAEA